MFGTWPNIKGKAGWAIGGPSAYWFQGGEGALYVDGQTVNKQTVLLGENYSLPRSDDNYIHIDASKASSIYAETKLQPTALSVLPCIRY